MAKEVFVHEDCYAYIDNDRNNGCAALAIQDCANCRFYKTNQTDPDTKSLISKYKQDYESGKLKKSKKSSKRSVKNEE